MACALSPASSPTTASACAVRWRLSTSSTPHRVRASQNRAYEVLLRKPRKIASVRPINEKGTKFSDTFQSRIEPWITVTTMASTVMVINCGRITGKMEPRHTKSMRSQCTEGRTIMAGIVRLAAHLLLRNC
ncbi:hypothetical protein D3C72_1680040 [compost metagenome]